jgi:Peptidase C39 family
MSQEYFVHCLLHWTASFERGQRRRRWREALHGGLILATVIVGGMSVEAFALFRAPKTLNAQSGNAESSVTATVPLYLRMEKWWNRGYYCGPNTLYILLRLLGNDVSFAELTSAIAVDQQRGCSLQDLKLAANTHGMLMDVRYVSPTELEGTDPPFIIHLVHSETQAQTGHFAVVYGFDPRERVYSVIDGTAGILGTWDTGTVYRSYSGYILYPIGKRENVIARYSSAATAGALVVVLCALAMRFAAFRISLSTAKGKRI